MQELTLNDISEESPSHHGNVKTQNDVLVDNATGPSATSYRSDKDYEKLEAMFERQKKIMRNEMHDAMSPISAISGYLDLMRLKLEQEENVGRLKEYRNKIEKGLEEINEIVENVHDRFDEDNGNQ